MIRRSTTIALWLASVLVFATAATAWRRQAVLAEHESAGSVAHRIVSQRADQHDAHMTNLSSLALTASPPPRESLLLVARNVMQFYPRIAAVDLVPFGAGEPISTRASLNEELAGLIREAVRPVSPKPVLVRAPEAAGHYLLIKRVPNTAAATHALALEIDAGRLADLDGTALSALEPEMAMPDGGALASPSPGTPAGHVGFERVLGSASQPLLLRLRWPSSLSAMVPWPAIAAFAFLAALAAAGGLSFASARIAAREARRHAAFREQEVRLAHASRINAMGELSLGIAHELTQPLAAILSQSQAGLRLAQAAPLDAAAVAKVLEANVRHARRAGDILAKLRAWVSAKPGAARVVDLDRAAADVAALTRADLAYRGIETVLEPAGSGAFVRADPVEVEQIIYNLVSNAADACAQGGRGGVVRLRTFAADGRVGLEVRDNGPGIPPEAMARIFEPFFTSKADGMGLGLALCQRLAEKFGGQLTAANHAGGGAVLTLTLPAADAAGAKDRMAAE
jgi:two-component system sensor kinase FixL